MKWLLLALVAAAVAVGWLGYDVIKSDWCAWMSGWADGACLPGFSPVAGPVVGAALGGVVLLIGLVVMRRQRT